MAPFAFVISWGGNFAGGSASRPLPTGLIPFWWDMLVVAAFSLIIYYWAQAVRLPRDKMLLLVEKQAATHGEAASTAGVG